MFVGRHDVGGGGGAVALRGAPALPLRYDLAVDLAENIGTRRWWRGLATLLLLLGCSWLLAPGINPLPAPSRPIATTAQVPVVIRAFPGPISAGGSEPATVERVVTAAADEPLAATLARAGLGMDDGRAAAKAIEAAAGKGPFAGAALSLTLGPRDVQTVPRPLERLSMQARADLHVALARSGAGFTVMVRKLAVERAPLRLVGRTGDGIFLSATAAGVPPEVVQDYLKAVGTRVDLSSLTPAARYEMVIERERASNGQVRFGKLLYAGLEGDGTALQMIEWTVGGRTGWYDLDGLGGERRGLVSPVDGRRTSGFGMRFHPILGYARMHAGVDYAAPYGSPVRAIADGVVSYAGWHGGHGQFVRLGHGGGVGSGYAHLSRFAVGPGERVAQGQVIGYVGSTGLSTGAHLHFELYRDGRAVNPEGAVVETAPVLSPGERASFKARMAEILALR